MRAKVVQVNSVVEPFARRCALRVRYESGRERTVYEGDDLAEMQRLRVEWDARLVPAAAERRRG